jgi:hypothetical protein
MDVSTSEKPILKLFSSVGKGLGFREMSRMPHDGSR